MLSRKGKASQNRQLERSLEVKAVNRVGVVLRRESSIWKVIAFERELIFFYFFSLETARISTWLGHSRTWCKVKIGA